jgi:hypothetical protein
MTKKQRREHKLGNALRAANLSQAFERGPRGIGLKSNQAGLGLLPRINRWAERTGLAEQL